jgi:hypothetical protein
LAHNRFGYLRGLILLVIIAAVGIADGQINGNTNGIAPFGSYTEDVLGAINAQTFNNYGKMPLPDSHLFGEIVVRATPVLLPS